MTERVERPSPDSYSPQRRTALLLTGTGADGAYHAGVIRALHEAGVKIDIVAGRGIGAIGAMFAAIDGGARLWEDRGFWRSAAIRHFYPWKRSLRIGTWTLSLAVALVALPLAAMALGLIVFPIDFVLKMVGVGGTGGLTAWYLGLAQAAFAPAALPTWLPRLVLLVLAVAAVVIAGAGFRGPANRPARGSRWWRYVPAPLSAEPAIAHAWTVLWDLVRGATHVRQPARQDLGRRYTELLGENLGQPGFRELLIAVHDVDARRDLIFALVGESRRRGLLRRASSGDAEARQAEVLDLSGLARDHFSDAVAAALTVPVATDFHAMRFAADSYWRGETHRLCDRPDSVARLVEELLALDVSQIILATAASDAQGPHTLAAPRVDGRERVSEFLQSQEAAVVRDVLAGAAERDVNIYLVRPAHNPVGPFDFTGGFDDRSARSQDLAELVTRGYEDAYHQFVEPIVGASGDRVGVEE